MQGVHLRAVPGVAKGDVGEVDVGAQAVTEERGDHGGGCLCTVWAPSKAVVTIQ